MERYFKWEGTLVPFPPKISWSNRDISTENSGRSKNAKMHKKIVAVKREIIANWVSVPDIVSRQILSTIKSKTFGNLTYPDAQTGADTTKRFYTGDAEAELIVVHNNVCYWNISISFVEQ